MTSPAPNECFYCGQPPACADELLRGTHGAICPGCVFALAARLAEVGRDGAGLEPEGASTSGDDTAVPGLEDDLVGNDGDQSAHDYASRMDLAAAYAEMGRRPQAVRELLLALESALLCDDYGAALSCVSRARRLGDSPALRDQICDALTRHSPDET
jgi:hypothetical protein